MSDEVDKIAGIIKESMGKATKDAELEAEGKKEQAAARKKDQEAGDD